MNTSTLYRISNGATGKTFVCEFKASTIGIGGKFYPVGKNQPMFWQRYGDHVVCPIWSDEPQEWVCEMVRA